MKNFVLIGALVALALTTQAQTKEKIEENLDSQKDKLRIKVERERGGQKQVFDKTYDTKGMSENEIDRLREKVLDSLDSKGPFARAEGKFRIRDRSDNDRIEIRTPNPDDMVIEKRIKSKTQPRVRVYEEDDMREFSREFGEKFHLDMNRFKDEMKRMGKDLEHMKFKSDFDDPNLFKFDMRTPNPGIYTLEGGSSTNSKTVKGLNVFPNNPFNNTLNVRFTAPEKGEVTIKVTDVTGKEIGKEVIKDFSGDFVGQIDLKSKMEKGTLFVTVTQGDDGSVKRVLVK